MGAYLDTPDTNKESLDAENDRLEYGVSSMRGWRQKQEDAYTCILDFGDGMSLFGVFDGHGGAEVAQYAVEMLPSLVKNEWFENGEFEKALTKAYLDFDDSLIRPPALRRLRSLRLNNVKTEKTGEKMLTWMINLFDKGDINDERLVETELAGKDSGCTAVVALLVNHKLYVANAGDSRCVVSVDHGTAREMSRDHKPGDETESKRILAAGGTVSKDGRIDGGLNTSRALGDHLYKTNKAFPNTRQVISALPDVRVIDTKLENGEFIILASDGVWNSIDSQGAVDFVTDRIRTKPDVKLSLICEQLFDMCIAPKTSSDGIGCDNMTCIIVKLKHNQPTSITQ